MHLFIATFSYLNIAIFLAFFNFAFHMNYSVYVCLNNVLWNILNKSPADLYFLVASVFNSKEFKYFWDSVSFKVSGGKNSFAGYTISLLKSIDILFIYLSNLDLLQ